jgi:hypothetical protein
MAPLAEVELALVMSMLRSLLRSAHWMTQEWPPTGRLETCVNVPLPVRRMR